MSWPPEQVDELKQFGTVSLVDEEGRPLLLIEGVQMPGGCKPGVCDVLLYPWPRDGYLTRLFFSELVVQPSPQGKPANWHQTARFAERNWHVFSHQGVPGHLRLAEILVNHVRALR